jgi:prevent-host-death family protein
MESIGAYEAKTHLPRLLDRVAHGERITITKHGVPVAILVPVGPTAKRAVSEVIEEIKRSRNGRKLRGVTIRQLMEEGHRY